jgi:signal transduction histidine kinase
VKQRFLIASGWTIAGSLAATFVFNRGSFGMTWRHFLEQSAGNTIFAGACVIPCVLFLPRVAPFAQRRLRFPFDWLLILAALVSFGIAGSLVAAMIGVTFGLVRPPSPFMQWYPDSMKISIYFTVMFGVGGTLVGRLRGRLAVTTGALRTKERDEAEARRLAAEAQLASLEARVDPHFLFNTLNSIAALVRDRPADAERVIEQLSSLMRSSLDRRASSLVTLDEELALVRSYLEIERIRFGERLRFRIESPSEHDAALVPRLSLQTLVENCVKYAVSPSREGAAVAVRAGAAAGRLHLSVEDDGPGFNSSDLPEAHGLHLLKSRLAMTFGEQAAFRIDSRPGCTTVVLDLPLTTMPPVPEVENRVEVTSKDLGCP